MTNTDLSQYIELFVSEAKDYVQSLSTTLVEVEKSPQDNEKLYNLMRFSHTLKGMAATMGFTELAELCHGMEDFFDAARNGEIILETEYVNSLFEYVDAITAGIEAIANNTAQPNYTELNEKLRTKLTSDKSKKNTETSESENNKNEIKTTETEEHKSPELKLEKISEVKVSMDRLDMLMSLVEQMLVLRLNLSELDRNKQYEKLRAYLDNLDRLVDDLQYNITQARMVEVGYLFNRFPRMVRDLALSVGKKVDLVIEGSEMELDRTIVDELGEPLVHLLRNAIDHGIESEGTIQLNAYRKKNYAIIEVTDNGNGIDIEKVKSKAIEKNIISSTEAQSLSEQNILNLIFHPQLSTKEQVTEISGRGVGMAAVKSKINALNGLIKIDTKKGEGTKFTLELPLTLAIIKGLLVKSSDQTYAIPANLVDRSVIVKAEQIKKAGGIDVAIINNEDIPVLSLSSHFELDNSRTNNEYLIVIVNHNDQKLGIKIDQIISEEEIVVKPLNSWLKKQKEFAGVTVLGDGRVVLILDIPNLV